MVWYKNGWFEHIEIVCIARFIAWSLHADRTGWVNVDIFRSSESLAIDETGMTNYLFDFVMEI